MYKRQMKNFMKELKPQSLEDVIAGISLYRPGPMDFIPQYIRGKNRPDTIKYDCPQLEPILKPTYGCIVYQEQVMQIVRNLAGYTLGRSDLVRRAMSKKKASVMEKERQNFGYGNEEEGVPGCIANGIPEKTANKIYDDMIDFAKYAFNKSHAAAYACLLYTSDPGKGGIRKIPSGNHSGSSCHRSKGRRKNECKRPAEGVSSDK